MRPAAGTKMCHAAAILNDGSAGHSTRASAGCTPGMSPYADTADAVHADAACLANFGDRLIRMVGRCQR